MSNRGQPPEGAGPVAPDPGQTTQSSTSGQSTQGGSDDRHVPTVEDEMYWHPPMSLISETYEERWRDYARQFHTGLEPFSRYGSFGYDERYPFYGGRGSTRWMIGIRVLDVSVWGVIDGTLDVGYFRHTNQLAVFVGISPESGFEKVVEATGGIVAGWNMEKPSDYAGWQAGWTVSVGAGPGVEWAYTPSADLRQDPLPQSIYIGGSPFPTVSPGRPLEGTAGYTWCLSGCQ